jgi:hypothetical protein
MMKDMMKDCQPLASFGNGPYIAIFSLMYDCSLSLALGKLMITNKLSFLLPELLISFAAHDSLRGQSYDDMNAHFLFPELDKLLRQKHLVVRVGVNLKKK